MSGSTDHAKRDPHGQAGKDRRLYRKKGPARLHPWQNTWPGAGQGAPDQPPSFVVAARTTIDGDHEGDLVGHSPEAFGSGPATVGEGFTRQAEIVVPGGEREGASDHDSQPGRRQNPPAHAAAILPSQDAAQNEHRDHRRIHDDPQQLALHHLEGLVDHGAHFRPRVVGEKTRQIEEPAHPGDHRQNVQPSQDVVEQAASFRPQRPNAAGQARPSGPPAPRAKARSTASASPSMNAAAVPDRRRAQVDPDARLARQLGIVAIQFHQGLDMLGDEGDRIDQALRRHPPPPLGSLGASKAPATSPARPDSGSRCSSPSRRAIAPPPWRTFPPPARRRDRRFRRCGAAGRERRTAAAPWAAPPRSRPPRSAGHAPRPARGYRTSSRSRDMGRRSARAIRPSMTPSWSWNTVGRAAPAPRRRARTRAPLRRSRPREEPSSA